MQLKLKSMTQSEDPNMSPSDLLSYLARVSNPSNQENYDTADKLIRYLLKKSHWSPFEMIDMTFEVKTTRDIGRQILRHRSFSFQELYYCENFKDFVNPLEEEQRFKSDKHAIPRIIIPFFDRNGVLFGFQGRALNQKEEIRYISIILDDSKPKAYGLNHIDFNKKYYVFEGPFDSMFIENSLGVCGSDALSVLNSINCNKQHAVIVFDNEPRNKQISNNINRFIELGWNVCIWPDSWEYKDINDAVKVGITPTIINHIIDENTYSGLVAKLKFTQWRKDAA